MRKSIGYLGALCIALFAFYPALANAGLPQGADVELHYWKTVELESIWNQGELLPRWAENFYYGYGAPTFQYTAPGPYGLAVLLGKLPLVDDITRIKTVWLIGLILGALGSYAYAAQRWGAASGLVCAAAFTFAPAIIYIEPIGRASYPASLGLGCIAASLALLDAYAHTRRYLLPLTLVLVGLLLSHNVTAVTGAALLAGWLIWQNLFNRHTAPYLQQAVIVFGLICAVTGFFWIPVVFERDAVSIDRLLVDPLLDFRIHFEPLPTLLQPVPLFDMNLWGQFGKRGLGVISWMLAAAGAIVVTSRFIQRQDDAQDSEMLYWFMAGCTGIFLITPQSGWLWENIELLETFQFPIRFLNIAALPLAILAARFSVILLNRRGLWTHSWMVILLMLGTQGLRSTPNRYADTYPRNATTADYFDHELNSGILGTTAANEFLPAAVVSIPPPSGFLLDSLAVDGPAVRINTFVYPEDVSFEFLDSTPSHYQFRINTPHEQRVEVFLFHFPGWRATRNGEPLATQSSGAFNFTILFVPPGDHIIEISYPLTAPQRAGRLLSVAALVALAFWRWQFTPITQPTVNSDLRQHLRPQALRLAVVVILGGVAVLGFMRKDIAWVVSPPGTAHLAPHSTDIVFAKGEVALLGYDVLEVQPDRQLRIGLYYDFAPTLHTPINSFVHLINNDGTIVAQSDRLAINSIRQNPDWLAEMHLRDQTILWLPDDLPPGEYRLRTGLWRCLDAVNSAECAQVERLPIQQDGANLETRHTVLDHIIDIG